MAGEWIAVDLSLPEKQEFQELLDVTRRAECEVHYLLVRMWGWASLHSSDGTARMTLPRMVRLWGGDEHFWRAVHAVGWLVIDDEKATITVPGWDRRFSKSAKNRMQHRDRAAAQEERRRDLRTSAGDSCAAAQHIEEIEEIEDSSSSSSTREGADPAAAWARLRAAWNAERRLKRCQSTRLPAGSAAFLEDDAWVEEAVAAVARLPSCRYFVTPVAIHQLFHDGFVQRVLDGGYDSPRDGSAAPARIDPSFEAARAATLAKLDRDRAELHGRLDAAGAAK